MNCQLHPECKNGQSGRIGPAAGIHVGTPKKWTKTVVAHLNSRLAAKQCSRWSPYRILRSRARRGRGSRARSTSSPQTRRRPLRETVGSTGRTFESKCSNIRISLGTQFSFYLPPPPSQLEHMLTPISQKLLKTNHQTRACHSER